MLLIPSWDGASDHGPPSDHVARAAHQKLGCQAHQVIRFRGLASIQCKMKVVLLTSNTTQVQKVQVSYMGRWLDFNTSLHYWTVLLPQVTYVVPWWAWAGNEGWPGNKEGKRQIGSTLMTHHKHLLPLTPSNDELGNWLSCNCEATCSLNQVVIWSKNLLYQLLKFTNLFNSYLLSPYFAKCCSGYWG